MARVKKNPENESETEQLSEFLKAVTDVVHTIMDQSGMKISVVRVSEEGFDRRISSEVFDGGVLDQENPRLLLKFIMSG